MAVTNPPSLDELAAHPERAASLCPSLAADLLVRLVTLQTVLLSRLLPSTAPAPPPAEDRPLTVPEVAARLHVGKAYVYDLIRRGEIAALRFGKYVRVAPTALREWEASHQEKALDRKLYEKYIPQDGGQRREWRRNPTHPKEAGSDASGTR